MEQASIWFNGPTPRRVKLRSATSLVGKEPTKQKRIKAMWTMKLDSGGEDQLAGLPDWLEVSRDFVMRNGETITAAHVVKEINMTMGDANLFHKTPVEAPHSQLDHFVIKQMGNADEPDTVLTFETRCAFSTDLWNWLGQQSGEEFDVAFEGIAPPADLTLAPPATEGEEEDEADASEIDPEDFEAQRIEALRPEHDAEFGHVPRKGKGKQTSPPVDPDVEHAKRALAIQ